MPTYRDDQDDDWQVYGHPRAEGPTSDLNAAGEPRMTHTVLTFRRLRDGEQRYVEIPTLEWQSNEVIRKAFKAAKR